MEVKSCARCHESKPVSEFFRQRGHYQAYCNPCKYAKQREWRLSPAGQAAKLRRRASDEFRTTHLKRKYGMTLAEYQQMLDQVNGRCEICGGEPSNKPLYVDHCHTTGRVRGLLCQLCNQMLGYAREDPATLSNAIRYLRERVPTERNSA